MIIRNKTFLSSFKQIKWLLQNIYIYPVNRVCLRVSQKTLAKGVLIMRKGYEEIVKTFIEKAQNITKP